MLTLSYTCIWLHNWALSTLKNSLSTFTLRAEICRFLIIQICYTNARTNKNHHNALLWHFWAMHWCGPDLLWYRFNKLQNMDVPAYRISGTTITFLSLSWFSSFLQDTCDWNCSWLVPQDDNPCSHWSDYDLSGSALRQSGTSGDPVGSGHHQILG